IIHQRLTLLDEAKNYWKNQLQSQWWYFAHKSPSKWFMGPAQKKEIVKKLTLIKKLRIHLLTELGTLTRKLHHFDSNAAAEEIYIWLVDVAQELLFFNKKTEIENGNMLTPAQLMFIVRDILEHTLHLRILLAQESATVAIPGHCARNWLNYL